MAYSPRPGQFIRSGERGTADIIGILKGGRFLGIEVKREGKNPTPEQLRWGEKVTKAGGLYLVAHSVDEVKQALEDV